MEREGEAPIPISSAPLRLEEKYPAASIQHPALLWFQLDEGYAKGSEVKIQVHPTVRIDSEILGDVRVHAGMVIRIDQLSLYPVGSGPQIVQVDGYRSTLHPLAPSSSG